MNVDIDKEDILQEMKDKHCDDLDFLFEIVESSTSSWSSMQQLTKRLLRFMDSHDSMGDITFFTDDDFVNKSLSE
ncbi:hypothetical protein [Tenacibaculum finnmarkense]|uniref:hypothetical protein n=1 Tax=Tenacibaculum finnmarkense TaxID=2781243 RepID=UPI001E3E2ABC|nr:hypothetical protein [Tenacibaculum finnmarkense]MCD8401339.1 hypothetical protein [Tenacibaculum finnmarkense genomovar ulcerans]MCD8411051.1 hypothetical protein [Tenacibaculum finnmarkense genomovar ulcerans]MCG8799001.1 hypothetical protein [Tenacibaculum finnmarkense]